MQIICRPYFEIPMAPKDSVPIKTTITLINSKKKKKKSTTMNDKMTGTTLDELSDIYNY